MARTFFAKNDATRKRQKRAAEQERIFTDAVGINDDDRSDKEMDIPILHSLSTGHLSSAYETNPAADISLKQTLNVVYVLPSSDEDDTDVEESISATDVNYQRKIYAGSSLSIYDACEMVIKLSRQLNLDKSKTNTLLHGIRSLLPNDNKLPRTIIGLMKILGR